MEYSTIEPWQRGDENGLAFGQGSLMAFFYDLLDLRHARGKRYSLVGERFEEPIFLVTNLDLPDAACYWYKTLSH